MSQSEIKSEIKIGDIVRCTIDYGTRWANLGQTMRILDVPVGVNPRCNVELLSPKAGQTVKYKVHRYEDGDTNRPTFEKL